MSRICLVGMLFAVVTRVAMAQDYVSSWPRISPRSSAFVSASANATSTSPHPSVARILVTERAAQAAGSGTLVDVREDCGLVITNWHVVRDATGEIRVVFPGGFQSPARVMKVDKDWDLAALVIWRPNLAPVAISSHAPQRGEPLMIAGYGSGDYRAVTGRCVQYVSPGAKFPMEMVELSAQARQGDSGGPIFNSQGELAGVLFGASRGTTCGSYGGRVRWFLASLAPNLGHDGLDPTTIANRAKDTQLPVLPVTLGQATPSAVANISPACPATGASMVTVQPMPQPQPVDQAVSHLEVETESTHMASRAPINGDLVTHTRPLARRDYVAPALGEEFTARAPSGDGFNWWRLIGHTPLEQGKSALAVLGVLGALTALTKKRDASSHR